MRGARRSNARPAAGNKGGGPTSIRSSSLCRSTNSVRSTPDLKEFFAESFSESIRRQIVQFHMDSHHFTHGQLDWRAAVLAGVIAGTVFLVLGVVLMALTTGGSLLEPPRTVAAIILG